MVIAIVVVVVVGGGAVATGPGFNQLWLLNRHIHHRHLLLFTAKADARFTIRRG